MRRRGFILPGRVGELGGWAEPRGGPADHQRAAELLESCTDTWRRPLQRPLFEQTRTHLIKNAVKLQKVHADGPTMMIRDGKQSDTIHSNRH